MPKNSKTISIVIPAYNEESHLRACLESIGRQTTVPDEVIVVNNNSTDATVEIVQDFPFVRVINEKQQGIAYARTTGFNAAQGEIIGRIDADTILPTDWVSQVLKFYGNAENEKTALTGGGYFYNIRLPRFNGWIQGQLAFRANRFVIGYYILWGSNMAIPRNVWSAVAPELCKRLDIHEDLDISIHLHEAGYKIAYHETMQVGVYLKRMWSQRNELHAHMRRWPQTLRVHHYKLWWLGVAGNLFLWYLMQPLIFVSEGLARLAGKPSIQ